MKAVVMTAVGGPEVLQVQDVPPPRIERDTEMLVRLKAAGINPIDTKLRKAGTYYPDRMPAILGCDGAGVVEAVGAAVTAYQPGDAVYFCHGGIGGQPGSYAEYAVIDAALVAPKPSRLSFAEAAAVPLVLITAWEALHHQGQLQSGQRVLIHAGAGGVGHVAIQLAKLAGARICTTVGSAAKAAFASGLGAEEAILYREQDFVERTLSWTNGRGVDLAFDTVGGSTFQQTFAAVRVYGILSTLLQPDAGTDWKLARLRNLRIALVLMLSPMFLGLRDHQQRQAAILRHCGQLFDRGDLRIEVSHTLPLEQAAEAHRLLGTGSMQGKVVLSID